MLYYTIILQEKSTKLEAALKTHLYTPLLAYVFKHMRDLKLDDLAIAMQFLSEIDNKKSDKFFKKLEEILTVTNPKLLKQPTPMSCLTFMSYFFQLRKGATAFWRKMTVLLE